MKRTDLFSLVLIGSLVIGLLPWPSFAAPADTPGIWKLTGSMATSRRSAQDQPLPDGRILVVGGTDTSGVDGAASTFYATAEIYDPATGTWTATGSLKTGGRALHSSTVLTNGKILITGGWNGSAALTSAEIYDPATGTFTAIAPMTTARAKHRDIRLFDGRVLITGGFDSAGNSLASAEIYNPSTGTFASTKGGPMNVARNAHNLKEVGPGKILVTGGLGAGGVALATAELFDPATETFTPIDSLKHGRANHLASYLPTGEVLITGGYGGGEVLYSTEIYDPDTNTFTEGPYLNQARQSHSSQLLPNGLVLISGGTTTPSAHWDIQTNFLSSAELYNPATGKFTPTGSKISATLGGNATMLWTGKFLTAGGGTNDAELYNPEMPVPLETWVATGNMATARTGHIWNLLDDGRVLLAGGLNSVGDPLATAELYDYITGTFSPTGDMATPRQHHRMAFLYTGKVLVTGGRPTATTGVLNSAELYDPITGTFGPTGNMLRYRRLHRATELRNGKILITGGLGGTSDTANSPLFGCELYDPAKGTFAWTTGPLNAPRRSHQAVLLSTGKVLIVGGNGLGSAVLNTAELYDPVTDSFTVTGNMNTARSNPRVARLPDGKILVAGGTSDVDGTIPIQSAEIYDPSAETFTLANPMSAARRGHGLIRLDNGKILIVGGSTSADASGVTGSAELYSHVTGKFSATGNLLTERQDFLHASLQNGRILVAGGVDKDGIALSSAELYTPAIGDEVDTSITSGPASLTNNTSATFTFSSTGPGSIFNCSLDGTSFTGCSSGQTYTSLADGAHRFQVHSTDSLGNTDPTPATYDWTITTVPKTTITSGPPTATKSTSATFTFESTMPGSTFECSLDFAVFSPCTSPKDYTKLKIKDHNFRVRAIAAGKDPVEASFDWKIDNKPPNTILTSILQAITSDPVAKFSFESTKAGGTFECSIDGAPFEPCASPWTSDSLLDGKHTFQVRAIDAAGNVDKSPAKSKAWTVDTTPPETTLMSKPMDPTTKTSAKFTFKSSEPKSTFQCSLDGAGFSVCKTGQVYSGLSAGIHHFEVKATDAAGNIDPEPAHFDWTIQ